MKKSVILAAAMLGVFAAHGQVRFGIVAGYNHSHADIKADVYYMKDLSYSGVSGFRAGLITDVPLGPNFSLQPGLQYAGRGYKAGGVVPGPADGPVNVTLTAHYHYLELPVNFLYNLPLGPGKLVAGIGPFLAYGISGRLSTNYAGYFGPEEKVIFLEKQRDYEAIVARKQYLRPFNAGAGITLGYTFDAGILVAGNYNMGLTDVEPNPAISHKSRSWSISVGYLFSNGN